MSLDTGDNPPTRRGTLQEAAKIMLEEGCRITRDLKDIESLYGYVMLSPDGQPFSFVCKSSDLYTPKDDPELHNKPITSIQRQTVTIANTEQQPIILAWWGNEAWTAPILMMYHPDEILTKWREKTNRRASVVMQNFPFYEGKRIYNIAELSRLWIEKMADWEKKKQIVEEMRKKQMRLSSYLG